MAKFHSIQIFPKNIGELERLTGKEYHPLLDNRGKLVVIDSILSDEGIKLAAEPPQHPVKKSEYFMTANAAVIDADVVADITYISLQNNEVYARGFAFKEKEAISQRK